ncbi:MAG: hypothetical protein JSV16_00560, partial [Candidatus Hydrogenedentota bacterium]
MTVDIRPMSSDVHEFQLAVDPVYPNLGLVGLVGASAGDAELDAALNKLIDSTLAPLKRLNEKGYIDAQLNRTFEYGVGESNQPANSDGNSPLLPGSRISIRQAVDDSQFMFAAVCEAVDEAAIVITDLGTYHAFQKFKTVQFLTQDGHPQEQVIDLAYVYTDCPGLREHKIIKGQQVIWLVHSPKDTSFFTGCKALANTPANRAHLRAELLKKNVQSFILELDYWGPESQTLYRMLFSVPTRLRITDSEKELFVQIDAGQAERIIEHLLKEGFLVNSSNLPGPAAIAPLKGPACTLLVWGPPGTQLYEDLGWGPNMLRRLHGLRNVLNGDAAKVMDKILGRLKAVLNKRGNTGPDRPTPRLKDKPGKPVEVSIRNDTLPCGVGRVKPNGTWNEPYRYVFHSYPDYLDGCQHIFMRQNGGGAQGPWLNTGNIAVSKACWLYAAVHNLSNNQRQTWVKEGWEILPDILQDLGDFRSNPRPVRNYTLMRKRVPAGPVNFETRAQKTHMVIWIFKEISADQPETTVQSPPVVLYSNDFGKTVGREWSLPITDTTPQGGRRFLGQFGNESVKLTLKQLAAHKKLTVSFDLFIIHSWDGNGRSGPDVWELKVDGGQTLLCTTFSNCEDNASNDKQTYPGAYPGGSYPARAGAAEINTLGYGRDSVYKVNFSFVHSASTLVLEFSAHGTQPIPDESWGLDNVRVTVATDQLQQPGWVELLRLADPAKDAVTGEWMLADGGLTADVTPAARISLPYKPPEEYDFLIEFSVSKNPSCIAQLVSRGDTPFTWSMNAGGRRRCRVEDIDGHSVIGNVTLRPLYSFEPGRKYTSTVEVRNDRVRCLINGEPIVEHKTDYSDLSRNRKWTMP